MKTFPVMYFFRYIGTVFKTCETEQQEKPSPHGITTQ